MLPAFSDLELLAADKLLTSEFVIDDDELGPVSVTNAGKLKPLKNGRWVTVAGTHLFISDRDGRVVAGPDHLKGKSVHEVTQTLTHTDSPGAQTVSGGHDKVSTDLHDKTSKELGAGQPAGKPYTKEELSRALQKLHSLPAEEAHYKHFPEHPGDEIELKQLGFQGRRGAKPGVLPHMGEDKWTEMTLDPRHLKIHNAQPSVIRTEVERKLHEGEHADLPVVVKHGNEYTLAQGNHRAVAELLARGKFRAMVTERKPSGSFARPVVNEEEFVDLGLVNEMLIEDEELGPVQTTIYTDSQPSYNARLSGGQWATIGGAHVYIKDGKIAAGPAVFKGKTLKQANAHATEVKKDVASAAKKVGKTGSKVEKAKAALEKARTELKKQSGGLATVRKQIKKTKVKSTAAQTAVAKAQKGKVTASTDIRDHIRKTNELTRKSVAGTLRSDEAEAHIKSLNKLNKDQVLRLAEATNISGNKTKKAALEAISNKLQKSGGTASGNSVAGRATAQTIAAREQHGKAIGKTLDDAMTRIKAGGDHKTETTEVHRRVDEAFKGVRLKAHAEAIARGFGIMPKGTISQVKDKIKEHVTARVGGYLRTRLSTPPDTTVKGADGGETSVTGRGAVGGASKSTKVAQSIVNAVRGGAGNLKEAYQSVKKDHPGLSLGEFHDHVKVLHEGGHIQAHSYNKTLAVLPSSEHAIYHKNSVLYDVTPGANNTPVKSTVDHKPLPKGLTDKLATFISDVQARNSFDRPSVARAYDHLKQFAPHMTEGQMHDVVRQAQAEGKVHSGPYTRAPATIGASEKPFYMDREIKNFLDTGPNIKKRIGSTNKSAAIEVGVKDG